VSGKRILIVDDERDCCDAFKHFFIKAQHSVDVAYDGLEARHLLNTHTYDFIFFDCNMPGLSGVELIDVINLRNPVARKIMISGYGHMNEEFITMLDIDQFLSKPIRLETLREIVEASGQDQTDDG